MGLRKNKSVRAIVAMVLAVMLVIPSVITAVPTYADDTFGITNVYGQNRYDTSIQIAEALKEELGVSRFDAVVVARGDAYPDALSGGYLAEKYSAPLIIVDNQNYNEALNYIRMNLKPGGTIFILGGTYAISNSLELNLRAITPDVMRLSGTTRYDTNLAILKESFSNDDDLLICSGENFPDALSASGAGRPIMLVGKSLTTEQQDFIREHSNAIRRVFIIGGTAAVNQAVEEQISRYRIPTRIFGSDRYGTSVAIASMFYPTSTEVTFASGVNFPDGLCGGVLAAKKNAPLLLTAQDTGFISSYQYVVNQPMVRHATVFGGPVVVSNDATGLFVNGGAKKTGLLDIGKDTYCTDIEGNLLKRTFFTLAGDRYYASRSGAVVKNTAFTVDGQYYGATSDGKLAQDGWAKTGNLHYYFRDYNITEECLLAKDVLDSVGRNLSAAYEWSRSISDYEFERGVNPKWGAEYFAEFGFKRKEGNSYVKAATLYYMANMLGYNARMLYGTIGSDQIDHAWVEITEEGMPYFYDSILTPGWRIAYYTDYTSYSRYNYPRNVMQVEEME